MWRSENVARGGLCWPVTWSRDPLAATHRTHQVIRADASDSSGLLGRRHYWVRLEGRVAHRPSLGVRRVSLCHSPISIHPPTVPPWVRHCIPCFFWSSVRIMCNAPRRNYRSLGCRTQVRKISTCKKPTLVASRLIRRAAVAFVTVFCGCPNATPKALLTLSFPNRSMRSVP